MKTIQQGTKGIEVYILQGILNAGGFLGKDGKPIKIDGNCGSNTVYAINSYQALMIAYGNDIGSKGKPDSKCGTKMWASLIKE